MLFDDESSLPLPAFSMPGLPPPKIPYLPSLGSSNGRHSPIIRHILTQFDDIENADWIVFNSFHVLEENVIKWMLNLWKRVCTIGPTIPSMYLDKRVEDDNAYGFNLYSTNSDDFLKWLNGKEKASVVYISFGSTPGSNLSSEQMVEVAEAVLTLSKKFSVLWVVKESEEGKLPKNFIEETNNKTEEKNCLIVRWCSQSDVLAHEAVGCFVSHCGWNSTMEAISFGVPIVAMPQILDQITNAYFVEHVWKIGVQPKVANSDEIGKCIEQILAKTGDEENEITKNATKWRELALQAISDGGSSDKNIIEIINYILSP
jgi:pathogen-inducible salicylic acid glucosyltransferase